MCQIRQVAMVKSGASHLLGSTEGTYYLRTPVWEQRISLCLIPLLILTSRWEEVRARKEGGGLGGHFGNCVLHPYPNPSLHVAVQSKVLTAWNVTIASWCLMRQIPYKNLQDDGFLQGVASWLLQVISSLLHRQGSHLLKRAPSYWFKTWVENLDTTSQKMEALCKCMWIISVHKDARLLGTWEITGRPIYLKENILIDKHPGWILQPSGSCAYWLTGTWLLTWAMVSFFNNKVLRERAERDQKMKVEHREDKKVWV